MPREQRAATRPSSCNPPCGVPGKSLVQFMHNRRRGGAVLKAPSFAYAKAKSLAEAFELIERPGAKILAGGQSLIPSLNMRLAHPELLVDITGLRDLAGIEMRPGGLRIGALATHTQIAGS